MGKRIKNYILFIIGLFLFVLHVIYSPYPKESLKKIYKEVFFYFSTKKVIKDSLILDKEGQKFYVLFYRAKELKQPYFLFQVGDYLRVIKKGKGVWIVVVPLKNYLNFKIKNLNTYFFEKGIKSLINYINQIPDSSLISFVIENEGSRKWNPEIEKKFKKMGAKISLKGKFRWSYVFVVKKINYKFIPLYEKVTEGKNIFLKLKNRGYFNKFY